MERAAPVAKQIARILGAQVEAPLRRALASQDAPTLRRVIQRATAPQLAQLGRALDFRRLGADTPGLPLLAQLVEEVEVQLPAPRAPASPDQPAPAHRSARTPPAPRKVVRRVIRRAPTAPTPTVQLRRTTRPDAPAIEAPPLAIETQTFDPPTFIRAPATRPEPAPAPVPAPAAPQPKAKPKRSSQKATPALESAPARGYPFGPALDESAGPDGSRTWTWQAPEPDPKRPVQRAEPPPPPPSPDVLEKMATEQIVSLLRTLATHNSEAFFLLEEVKEAFLSMSELDEKRKL
jgi:hypothetical protein